MSSAVDNNDYKAWVGRSETRADVVTTTAPARLSAILDRDDPLLVDGDDLPPLAHWLFFLPDERQTELGPDGHALRGGFLPPVDELPRRMWAGSRFYFADALAVGMHIERCSEITQVTCKRGRSGPLIFVTVSHRISEKGGKLLVTEEHDIVYRGLGATAAKPAEPHQSNHRWERRLVPDSVMLFRFSALTFNGHRIHYDRDYARDEEGYPGLVVHGPLVGMLLLDLAHRNNPDSQITHFSFRALAPVFEGQTLTLKGLPDPDQPQKVTLWCENHQGGRTMKARIQFA